MEALPREPAGRIGLIIDQAASKTMPKAIARLTKLRSHTAENTLLASLGTDLALTADMEASSLDHVSFVGGPYDGCVSPRQANQALCGQLAMPVSANILRMLSGEAACDGRPIRAVASYRLALTARGPRYYFHSFHRIGPAESKELSDWHHSLLCAWNKIQQARRR
jgi:hypothetical protein